MKIAIGIGGLLVIIAGLLIAVLIKASNMEADERARSDITRDSEMIKKKNWPLDVSETEPKESGCNQMPTSNMVWLCAIIAGIVVMLLNFPW